MNVKFDFTVCKTKGVENLLRIMFDKGEEDQKLSSIFREYDIVLHDPRIWVMSLEGCLKPHEKTSGLLKALREAFPWFIFETWLLEKENIPVRYYAKPVNIINKDCQDVLMRPKYWPSEEMLYPPEYIDPRLTVDDIFEKTEIVKISQFGTKNKGEIKYIPIDPDKDECIYYQGSAQAFDSSCLVSVDLSYNKKDDLYSLCFKFKTYLWQDMDHSMRVTMDKEGLDILMFNLKKYSNSSVIGHSESLILRDVTSYYRKYFVSKS